MRTLETEGNAQAGSRSEEILALGPWFHNLHLPDGTQTAPEHPLGDFPNFKWQQIAPALPDDLSGMKALDIGCNAGFYSFALAERGAEVLGIDVSDRYLRQAEWAAEQFGVEDQVRFERRQVYDLARMDDEFDLVLFMGVFYHLRYPVLALDAVSCRCRSTLVFQSLSMPGERDIELPRDMALTERELMAHEGWPKMAYIPERLAGDPTNWWAPNRACVRALLDHAGFRIVASPGHEIVVAERTTTGPNRALLAELAAATGFSEGSQE